MGGLSSFGMEIVGDLGGSMSFVSFFEWGVGFHLAPFPSFISVFYKFFILINLLANHGVIDLSGYLYIIKCITKLALYTCVTCADYWNWVVRYALKPILQTVYAMIRWL